MPSGSLLIVYMHRDYSFRFHKMCNMEHGNGEWLPTTHRGRPARRGRPIDEGNFPRPNLGLHADIRLCPRWGPGTGTCPVTSTAVTMSEMHSSKSRFDTARRRNGSWNKAYVGND